MGALGYTAALLTAVVPTAAAFAVVARGRKTTTLNVIYLFLISAFGVVLGAKGFGTLGRVESLSAQGPAIDGFHILTGLAGGAILVALAAYALLRSAEGQPTDVEAEGIHDPKIAHLLFSDNRSAPLWLGIRLFIGVEWLAAGWEKVNSAGWMNGGAALKGYWTSATAVPTNGHAAITYGWYRDVLTYMLNHEWYTWFAKLVAVGELLVGIALIVGLVVGIAAFFGTLMNFSYMLAGSASTNPVLFGLTVFLVLAWKVAGYYGLDRVFLPALGAPWSPGRLFRTERGGRAATHA